MPASRGILRSATHDALVRKIPARKREGDAEVCVCVWGEGPGCSQEVGADCRPN